tara:strand:+ start:118 stop:597 length:480 start_codon:yes stop_codon:yes gene_type:complete
MFCVKARPKTEKNKDYESFMEWKQGYEKMSSSHSDIFFKAKFENNSIYAEVSTFGEGLQFTIIKKELILEKTNEMVEDECSICLKQIKGLHSKPVECSHHFHTKCIEQYIKKNNENNIITRCPICRGGPEHGCEDKIASLGRYWSKYSYSSDSDYSDGT